MRAAKWCRCLSRTVLSRNGTFMAYRRLQQHVGAFRDFLRQHGGPTAEGQELIAAKLMGRWRSGAPLVLAAEKDDPALGADYNATIISTTRKWTRKDMQFR